LKSYEGTSYFCNSFLFIMGFAMMCTLGSFQKEEEGFF
jgi:hypothetical protein